MNTNKNYWTIFSRYRKNAKQAVDSLTFGVQRAECFGLLGESGQN